MERRKVEITVKSCKDLKNFNFFQKMSVFAEVWIGDDKKNKQRTLSDHHGDRNPEWRQKLVFDLAGTLQYVEEVAVEFEIRREGIGDTFLGWVRVPMKELIQDHNDGVDQRLVSYQVKGKSGEGVGILNFSYKIHRKHRASSDPPPNSKLETIQMASAGAPSAPPLPVGVESELPAAVAYPTITPPPPAWQYPTTAAAQYPTTAHAPLVQVSQYPPASVYPPPATTAITETPYPPPVYPPPLPVWSTQPIMYTYPPPPPPPQAGMYPPGGGYPPPPPQAGIYPPAPRPTWYPPGPVPGPYPPLPPSGYPVRPPDPYYQYHGGPWRPY